MIRILLAGQGGQGVLSAGKMLAESGLWEGKEVSYLPAYGPEMRGGTANCSVIISEEEIASPLCNEPDVLIAMNGPSFHKFAPRVKTGGIVIVNGSMSDCYAAETISPYTIFPQTILRWRRETCAAPTTLFWARAARSRTS